MVFREMKYKYNISYQEEGKRTSINFNSKDGMITYLNKNTNKINELTKPVLNFGAIALPLKTTVWRNN
jgi:hypothetical protein